MRMKNKHTDTSTHSWCRHPRSRLWWWSRFPGLRHPSSHCQVHRTSIPLHECKPLSQQQRTHHQATSTTNPLSHRSPTTRSSSMSTARTSSSRLSSLTTAHSSLPTTGKWSPRSSVVRVPAPGTRSLTVKQFATTSPSLHCHSPGRRALLYLASLMGKMAEVGLLRLFGGWC